MSVYGLDGDEFRGWGPLEGGSVDPPRGTVGARGGGWRGTKTKGWGGRVFRTWVQVPDIRHAHP